MTSLPKRRVAYQGTVIKRFPAGYPVLLTISEEGEQRKDRGVTFVGSAPWTFIQPASDQR